MPLVQYIVVPDEDCWKIDHEGRRVGEFPSRDAALETAVNLAQEANGIGHDAEVLVRREDGALEEEAAWRGRAAVPE